MQNQPVVLTEAEWKLMECLWTQAPRTGRACVQWLQTHAGWTRSTTLTMLRRMTEKGLVRCEQQAGVLCYTPMLQRSDAEQTAAERFLNRVFHGSVSMMLSSIARKQSLSREEIDALYAIVQQADEAQKDQNS